MLPVGADVSKWVHCVCLDINIGILSCLIESLVISHCINLVTERIYGDFLPLSLSLSLFVSFLFFSPGCMVAMRPSKVERLQKQ